MECRLSPGLRSFPRRPLVGALTAHSRHPGSGPALIIQPPIVVDPLVRRGAPPGPRKRVGGRVDLVVVAAGGEHPSAPQSRRPIPPPRRNTTGRPRFVEA